MPAAAVNHPHAGETRAHGAQQEFLQREPRILEVETVQIEMRLNGKPAGAKVIQVQAAMRVNRTFDVFGRVLDLNIAFPHELFEGAQGVLLLILSLDFDGCPVVEWNSAPT